MTIFDAFWSGQDPKDFVLNAPMEHMDVDLCHIFTVYMSWMWTGTQSLMDGHCVSCNDLHKGQYVVNGIHENGGQ